MSTIYDLNSSKENPVVTKRTLDFFRIGLNSEIETKLKDLDPEILNEIREKFNNINGKLDILLDGADYDYKQLAERLEQLI